MSVTSKIDSILKERNMTKADLCRKSGLASSTLSSIYTRGDSRIQLETLKKIAEALDVSMDYLVRDEYIPSVNSITFTSEQYTYDELQEIKDYARFILSKRK